MIDVKKQIAFWYEGAIEDWAVARDLVDRGRVRHGLFFAHLSLEKALKALVCRATQDLAPRLHNLVRLAELAQIPIKPDQIEVLAVMNAFNIEGRYPDSLSPPPTQRRRTALYARGQRGIPMVDSSVERSTRKYLRLIRDHGIPVRFGVVFGSQTTGRTDRWSDIDVLVVSPWFDGPKPARYRSAMAPGGADG